MNLNDDAPFSTSVFGFKSVSAKDRFMKELAPSDIEPKSESENISNYEMNNDWLEGTVKPDFYNLKSTLSSKKSKKSGTSSLEEDEEPLGYIEYDDKGNPQVLYEDQYLGPFKNDVILRHNEFRKWLDIFEGAEGGLVNISRSFNKFGLHVQENGDIQFQEWAPGAKSMSIFGDFNGWNREEFKCHKNQFGCFTITLKALEDGTPRIKHRQRYKLQIEGPDGVKKDRNSVWANWQNQTGSGVFDCSFWNPPDNEKFKWTHENVIGDNL